MEKGKYVFLYYFVIWNGNKKWEVYFSIIILLYHCDWSIEHSVEIKKGKYIYYIILLYLVESSCMPIEVHIKKGKKISELKVLDHSWLLGLPEQWWSMKLYYLISKTCYRVWNYLLSFKYGKLFPSILDASAFERRIQLPFTDNLGKYRLNFFGKWYTLHFPKGKSLGFYPDCLESPWYR